MDLRVHFSTVCPLILAVSLAAAGCGHPQEPDRYNPNEPTEYNVVLVTLDGLRWQEFFGQSDPLLTPRARKLFPEFWSRVAPRGQVFGNPRKGQEMTVSTAANASLPGYTSIFAEQEQGCLTNFCGRIEVPTFLDRLHDELPIARESLAVFASWSKLSLAVSGRDDVAVIRAAGYSEQEEVGHPEAGLLDDTLEFDRGTVINGFSYLKQVQPRFLYLSFLDSDRYGHVGNYERYLDVMGAYDRLLAELVDRLDAMGEYGEKTALVLTTDHGRGMWDQWSEHGPQIPSSGRVWSFVMLPRAATELETEDPNRRTFTHHDVRYTVETLFGLSTTSNADHSTGLIRRKQL